MVIIDNIHKTKGWKSKISKINIFVLIDKLATPDGLLLTVAIVNDRYWSMLKDVDHALIVRVK